VNTLAIMNPVAGRVDPAALRRTVEVRLGEAGIECTFHETREGEHAGDVVRRRLVEGFETVVAIGGDGTVSAALDGLHGTGIPLGIIPVGTGNFVAQELGIPQSVQGATELLTGPVVPVKVDAMRIAGRIYVLNVGVGVSAAVVGDTPRTGKRRFGFLAYVGTAIVKVLTARPRRLSVVVDGHAYAYRAVEVMVSNCGVLTKRLYPYAPDIRADDGRLDVCVMSTQALFDYPRYLWAMLFGRRPRLSAEFLQAEHTITIQSSVPRPVQADGDIIGTTPVEIEVLPGALTVLAPPQPSPVPPPPAARSTSS